MSVKKITIDDVRKIVAEELLREFSLTDERLAKAAAEFGSVLGGRPDIAQAVADVLKAKEYTASAEALMAAYQKSQNELDMEYSLHYPE